MKNRTTTIDRATRETDISCTLNIDGEGKASIDTGIGFFDHMLEAWTKHSLFDLTLTCKGDLHVDDHHTVEDVGLVLGQAIDACIGDKVGINRYGWFFLPMDEALSRVALDLGGRPFFVYSIANRRRKIGTFDLTLFEEFWRAFSTTAKMNLHIAHLYGKDPHHAHESVFKGVARALKMAVERDARVKGVPSSKGAL